MITEFSEDIPVARLSLGKDYVVRRRNVEVFDQATSKFISGSGLPSVGFIAATKGGEAIATLSATGVEGAEADFSAIIPGDAMRAALADKLYTVVYDRMRIGTSDTDDVPLLVVPSAEPGE